VIWKIYLIFTCILFQFGIAGLLIHETKRYFFNGTILTISITAHVIGLILHVIGNILFIMGMSLFNLLLEDITRFSPDGYVCPSRMFMLISVRVSRIVVTLISFTIILIPTLLLYLMVRRDFTVTRLNTELSKRMLGDNDEYI